MDISNIFEKSISLSKERIMRNRHYFMGVAMILVVLYHCYCSINDVRFLLAFWGGYFGVDIFFFFSGMGLSFSYTKNSLPIFYKNRLKRIMPLYWIWAIVHILVVAYNENLAPNMLDVIGLSTTLSYYGIGAIRSNWYLSALISFYVLFPILFMLVKRFKLMAVLSFCFLSFLIVTIVDLQWYHNAFIGRFYIFALGIYTYFIVKDEKKESAIKQLIIAIIILAIIGSVSLLSNMYKFWGASCFCPVLIYILSLLPCSVLNSKFINLCGKYSLEIFIANCWTMLIMNYGNCIVNPYLQVLVYFVSNTIMAIVLVYINKFFTNCLSKCQMR